MKRILAIITTVGMLACLLTACGNDISKQAETTVAETTTVASVADTVEEVVEDAWLTLWQTIPPERPKYLKAYICRVVKNLSLKRREYLMAQKRSFNVEGSSSYEVALEELEECVKAPETVENVVEGTELKAVLEHFLEGLPRDKRVMFLRRYWFADSVKEISRDFRISEKAASMRLSRIREELRRYLRKEGYEV